MNETQKMFQAIINGQSAMKSELLGEIQKVDKKLISEIGSLKTDVGGLREEMKQGFEKLTKRVDKIGLQVAGLEDDAPTGAAFDNLERRVKIRTEDCFITPLAASQFTLYCSFLVWLT